MLILVVLIIKNYLQKNICSEIGILSEVLLEIQDKI